MSKSTEIRDNMSNPGLNLFKIRCMLHMTQTEVAKTLGVSCSLVALWENGKRNISSAHAQLISERLGVSLDYLLNAPPWIPTFQLPELA